MTRIDITYDGLLYTAPDADLDDLRSRIQDAVTGTPFWLEVNSGAGSYRPTEILVAPGISIALAVTPEE